MKRRFNTEGNCIPKKHYMVRLDERLRIIKEQYIEEGSYFVINRGRQYGKTTTLRLLAEYLKKDYGVLSMDFQKLDSDSFKDGAVFSRAFARLLLKVLEKAGLERVEELMKPIRSIADSSEQIGMAELFERLSDLCEKADKPLVMVIDEVDSAANNQVFLDFLALLRGYYLNREDDPIFHSVILAGLYDIKNLKLKLRPDSEHQYNSPWNIAAEFDMDMGFSSEQIAGMLREYEAEQETGMDVEAAAEEIYQYTSGYPYLVSAICKLIDEQDDMSGSPKRWDREGIAWAVNEMLKKKTPLFDSLIKQLDTFKELRNMIEEILYQGKRIPFSPYAKEVNLGVMFGFLKEKDGQVMVANRMFEMSQLNLFMTEESVRSEAFRYGEQDKSSFIRDGRLDMERVLEWFVVHYHDIYGDNDEKFIEKYGRKFFLLYLKPIINGTGNYYLEAQTRDAGRTDVVVDYRGEQFVVELKIWRGNEYNERGEEQLAGYLDYFHQKKGFLLSFNFNQKKEIGVKTIALGEKTIVEAVV